MAIQITETVALSNLKLGIIAGGQLGKMLIQEATKWDIDTYILDSDENCPSRSIASQFVQGKILDFDDVYNFGKQVDMLTFEIEAINVEALKKLKSEGVMVAPDPFVLELIQDKGLQKNFYRDQNVPTVPYRIYSSKEAIMEAVAQKDRTYPFVQKLCRGGYDGRGVAVINSENDLGLLLNGASVVEEKADIDKEIAVIAARNENGEIRCFPVVEMGFDSHAHLVEKLICPSSISPQCSHEAEEIAKGLIGALGMTGLLAVELFVTKQGKVLVNEAAPRPHNSGHHTIESALTSQFEQHLRAIFNLPLGSTRLKMPAVMLNILGDIGHHGPVKYEGFAECLAIEGVNIHLYGKKITRPFRKMGHITIIANSTHEAMEKAEKVRKLIKVTSW